MKTLVRTLAILSVMAMCGASVAKAGNAQPQTTDDQEPQYDEQEFTGAEEPMVFVNPETGEALKVSPDGNTVIPLDKSKITIQKGNTENLAAYPRGGYRGFGRGWGGGWGRGMGWGGGYRGGWGGYRGIGYRGWGWRGGWGGRPWGWGYRGHGWGPRWGWRGWYGRGWAGRGLWYGRGWYGSPYYWRRWYRGAYWYPGYSCNSSYGHGSNCYCY